MSGVVESPPTYYFSGVTFNPSFYTTTSSDYLTKTTARKYFLSYPTAQGDETIDRLYSSQISTPTPTENFNFLDTQTANIYVGENVSGTDGQVIQIGAPTLTKIRVGNLQVIANALNHASSPSTGVIAIGDLQTDALGHLNIGTHVSRLGQINIGTGNSTTATPIINIGATLLNGTVRAGATINIGRMTTNAITIGHSTANVTISSSSGSIKTAGLTCTTQTATGEITASGGITIPVGKTLTANGGIKASSIDTTTTIMAIGALSTGGITLGATNAATTIAGDLTVSGQITANGLLTATIGTISGATSIITFSANANTLVGGTYNLNLLVVCSGTANKTITLMDPIINQNIIFRGIQTGGTTITLTSNGSALIIHPLATAVVGSSVTFNITQSLRLISDEIKWYVH